LEVYKESTESRLGKLFSTLETNDTSKFVLPQGMEASELKDWIQMMIKDAQPRHLRKEGRKSFDLKDYKIPFNYFVVESNTVNFSLGSGPIVQHTNGPEDGNNNEIEFIETKEEIIDGKKRISIVQNHPGNQQLFKSEQDQSNYTSTIHPYLKTNDYGTMICLHIFKNGRKTIDELLRDVKGIEKHLMTMLVNKLIVDGYLQQYQDIEKDENTEEERTINTLELTYIEKDDKQLQVKKEHGS
jgi:hypothetical protein